MKTSLKIFAMIFALSFLSTGCYTIVWDPNQEFPDQETYIDDSASDFYDYEDYGGYVDYYESPWWVTPVVYITTTNDNGDKVVTKVRNDGRNSDTEEIRNSGGRGNTDGTNIITTPTVTKTTDSNSSNSSSDNNTSTRESSNNNSNNSSNNSNTRSSGSSDTRNNSGSRNSGGRR